MALLGMGSNVESNSYFQQCYLTGDIGGNDNDCIWPRIFDDKLVNDRRCSNSLFTQLLADRQLELNKEVLKQIMLKHESIFKDQICELHRLYRRQRDLMAEIKVNKFYKLNRHGEKTLFNISSSQASTGYDSTAFQVPKFPCPKLEYSQLSFSHGENVLLPSIHGKSAEKGLHPMHIESPLEKPCLLELKCRKFGKKMLDLELPAEEYIDWEEELPVKDMEVPLVSKYALAKIHDLNILPHSDELLLSTTLSGKTKIMADLNEPVIIEDEEASTIDEDFTGPYGKSRSNLVSSSVVLISEKMFLDSESFDKQTEPEKSEKTIVTDLNCYIESISETQNLENERVSFGRFDQNLLQIGTCFGQLRKEDESSSTSPIDLEAPASPGDEKSDEDKLEGCCSISRPDDTDQDELVRIAAEVMISISLSGIQTSPTGSSSHLSETLFESLVWFSQIVCSTLGDSESGVKSADNLVYFPENGMDYFEDMTLKLKDMKVEEDLLHSNAIKGEGKIREPSSSQPLKGRTRRGRQRKDFQTKILPGLVSLSRYEVTEDLQTIGSLMEMTKTGKNGSFRRKRQTCLMDSMIKQLPGNGKLGSEIQWGKITRRRRGRRYPARHPQLILGQK